MYDDRQTEELKSYLLDYAESRLQKDAHNKKLYICPICGSGSRGTRDSDGAFSIKNNFFKCFSCNATGDIFNLIGVVEGITDFKDQKQRAIDLYGTGSGSLARVKKSPEPLKVTPSRADFSKYCRECALAIAQTDYLKNRGFTDETIKKFSLGFDREHNAIVIPYSDTFNYYITRSIKEKKFYKPRTEEAGAEPLFNISALYSKEPCFVCESQLDAISIEQIGGRAVAIGGTGDSKLIEAVKLKKPTSTLILSLDNDNKGIETSKKITKELEALAIPFIEATYTLNNYPVEKRKDANDLLTGNAKQFATDVESNIKKAKLAVIGKEALEVLSSSNISNYLKAGFSDDIRAFRSHNKRLTGFDFLDSQSGGLYNGFYVIGAISSLGKTTFVHQIADQLASSGEHILYFSLEQTRLELVTKSISRLIAKRYGTKDPVSSIAIRDGHYNELQQERIIEAIKEYQQIADNITIVESTFNADVDFIRKTTENYITVNGVKPIVIVDYLQIITEDSQSDKQKIDNIVKGLKRLQSEYSLVLIAISSVNRSNYLTPVDFESFKESGIIEYSTDVVYGLQLQCITEPLFNKDNNIIEKRKKIIEAKSATPRKIELVCLKNRYGISNYSSHFDYYPTCDYFRENLEEIIKKETVSVAGARI